MGKLIKRVVLSLFIIFIIIIIGFSIYLIKLKNELESCKQISFSNKEQKFELLSSDIAWMDVEEFLKYQKKQIISYQQLKPNIESILKDKKGTYGLYFEDLVTGAWIGINEKERFIPASLLKLPVMVAILKKIERGELDLNQEINILPIDIYNESLHIWNSTENKKATIQELLTIMIKYSDNTAATTLYKLLNDTEKQETLTALGFPYDSDVNSISPKEYSNMLRALYFSTYLRRTFSETALSIMMETNFSTQLPGELPKEVKIAHKVGFYEQGGYFHDCGIIYLKENPYILCVMSKNSDIDEATKVIKHISKDIYNYMETNKN